MNRKTLFAYLRRSPFGGRLTAAQVDGVEAILKAFTATGSQDMRFLAYILATAFHETAATMQPVRETLASSDAKAIAILDRAKASGRLPQVKTAYWRLDRDGKSWLGRGFVQLTHKANYEKAGEMIGVDLVANPARAMEPRIAAAVLVNGMLRGIFTGKKLSDYFTAAKEDATGARRIINGTDKAKLIASHYSAFLGALNASQGDEAPEDVQDDAAKPDDVPAGKSMSAITAIAAPAATGIAAPMIGGIDNVYALIFSLAALGFAAVLLWLFMSGKWSVSRVSA